MQESILIEIIEQAFDRLSSPMRNSGVYKELQNAITRAYKLGKQEANSENQQQAELQQQALTA
jgi:hypothetical protein